jgi:RNA polymerase sigma-70 factor (ECF subfamily)
MPNRDLSETGRAQFSALFGRARAGSSAELATLVNLYRPYLKRLAHRKLNADVRPKEGSSDVVQRTVIDAQADFANCRATTPAELRLWLRKILTYNLFDVHRRYLDTQRRDVTRETRLDEVEPITRVAETALTHTDTPSDALLREEDEDLVHLGLAQLKNEYQEAILLRFQDKLTYAEIGEALGKSPGAAESLVKRAVYKLGLILKKDRG